VADTDRAREHGRDERHVAPRQPAAMHPCPPTPCIRTRSPRWPSRANATASSHVHSAPSAPRTRSRISWGGLGVRPRTSW